MHWKRLYESGNGWNPPSFEAVPTPALRGFLAAMAFSPVSQSSAPHVQDTLLVATDEELQLWDVRGGPSPGATLFAGCQLPQDEIVHSIVQLRDQSIVTGHHQGYLSIYRCQGDLLSRVGRVDLGGLPVVDVQEHPLGSSLVVAITDCTFTSNTALARSNQLHFVDPAAEAVVSRVSELMDEYQLLCFGIAPGSGGSCDVVAASVQGDFCGRCFEEGLPSLCFHKSQVRACLCSCDFTGCRRGAALALLPQAAGGGCPNCAWMGALAGGQAGRWAGRRAGWCVGARAGGW